MGWSVYSHAWRAGIVACGLAWFGAADSRAEGPEPPASTASPQPSAEPFGLAATALPAGGLRDKWLAVQRRLDDEMVLEAAINCGGAIVTHNARDFGDAPARFGLDLLSPAEALRRIIT